MSYREDRLEVYKAADGWRWRKVAPNGETIATGEAYTRRGDAVEGARRANPGVELLVVASDPLLEDGDGPGDAEGPQEAAGEPDTGD